jgi:glycogen debranching enzyme
MSTTTISSDPGRLSRYVVPATIMLSFVSFWRAAAIVLSDLGSTAYYIGGIAEKAIGKAASWFILGIMLFSYAVRAVYLESCSMFVRGGVYRVVREAMHQAWKDSNDAIFHADGSLARGPIAACEVQGYAFAAWRAAAALAAALGRTDQSADFAKRSEKLKADFDRVFWCDEVGTYALALDGDKRPCRVRTSNAGQCLYSGIVHAGRAARLAQTLLAPESFSGWGIRTVASNEPRYNAMGYHNGGVSPHDNALIACGLARYPMVEQASRIFTGLFDTAMYLDLHRVPELFCGFPRDPGEGAILYPVACAPQAWSAASVFLLFHACLGLTIDGVASKISFVRPWLPSFLNEARILNLKIAKASVDLAVVRHENDVSVKVLRKSGDVEIVVVM